MMIKTEKLLFLVVGFLSILIILEIIGVFDKKEVVGYSEKEVALIMKVKDLDSKIEKLEIEYEIIEKDNERIKKNIGADSSAIFNSSRNYRDSLRAIVFGR